MTDIERLARKLCRAKLESELPGLKSWQIGQIVDIKWYQFVLEARVGLRNND